MGSDLAGAGNNFGDTPTHRAAEARFLSSGLLRTGLLTTHLQLMFKKRFGRVWRSSVFFLGTSGEGMRNEEYRIRGGVGCPRCGAGRAELALRPGTAGALRGSRGKARRQRCAAAELLSRLHRQKKCTNFRACMHCFFVVVVTDTIRSPTIHKRTKSFDCCLKHYTPQNCLQITFNQSIHPKCDPSKLSPVQWCSPRSSTKPFQLPLISDTQLIAFQENLRVEKMENAKHLSQMGSRRQLEASGLRCRPW